MGENTTSKGASFQIMPESSSTIFLFLSGTEKSCALVIQTRRKHSL